MKLQNLIHILIGIVCIGLLPGVQAISPPPEGGYPGYNTAEGTNALFNLISTVASGIPPLVVMRFFMSDWQCNTALGTNALLQKIWRSKYGNGVYALFSNRKRK